MGQKHSREQVHCTPPVDGLEDYTMLKKAGSLSTLATHGRLKKEQRGSLKRSRSFTDTLDNAEFVMKLRERVEKEARELNEWVDQSRSTSVPSLLALSSLVVASCLKTPLDVERLPCNRELKRQVEFMVLPVFDEPLADPLVSFSNGGHTIVYKGKSYSTTVLSTQQDRGLHSGRHAWIYYIENSRVQGWVQLGIVDKARWCSKCRTMWDGNPHPFRKGEVARRSNGNFHSGRDASEATIAHDSIFLGGYGRGDTIGMKLDCDKHVMCWTKNGEDYGKPVTFPSGPVWPSVSLDSPGEAVSLIYYTCSVRSSAYRKEYQDSSKITVGNEQSISIKPLHVRPPAALKKHATIDRI